MYNLRDFADDFNNNSRPPENYFTVPTVITTDNGRPVAQDIFSRLLSDNVIPVVGPITDTNCEIIVAAMLQTFYDKIKPAIEKAGGDPDKVPEKDRKIKFLINSPGGSVHAGMQVYDAMQLLKNEGVIIETHAKGIAMSMGSVLLMAGSEGYRKAWPNAQIMLHQVAGGASGKWDNVQVSMKEMEFIHETLRDLYKPHTNLTDDELKKIFTGTDYFLRAEEAVELGVIDKVLYPENNAKLTEQMKKTNIRHWQFREDRVRPYQEVVAANQNNKKGPQNNAKQKPGMGG